MGIRKKLTKRLPIIGRRLVRDNQPQSSAPSTGPTAQMRPAVFEPPPPAHERGDQPPMDYISEVVSNNAVVLFMKGTPMQPLCGFSSNAAGILSSYGAYKTVDVIADSEVRTAIKDYSRWPTLPQVYIGGEFVGGSDILRQSHDTGELQSLITQAVENLNSTSSSEAAGDVQ